VQKYFYKLLFSKICLTEQYKISQNLVVVVVASFDETVG